MIDSTDTARAKWCPMTRQVWARFQDNGSFTSLGGTPPFNMVREDRGEREDRVRCIASDCMMWRDLGAIKMTAPGRQERKTDFGYCGLAGQPPLPEVQRALLSEIKSEMEARVKELAA